MRYIKGNVEREAATKAQAERLKKQGFQTVRVQEAADENSGEGKPLLLDEMTAAQLRALAKNQGIEGANSMAKKELLELLKDVVPGE